MATVPQSAQLAQLYTDCEEVARMGIIRASARSEPDTGETYGAELPADPAKVGLLGELRRGRWLAPRGEEPARLPGRR